MRSASREVCLVMPFLLAACSRPEPPERVYLDAARQAAAWIGSTRVETPHGPAWPADARKPETVQSRLGDGAAGVVLFFLELHRSTGDAASLEAARRGADYLLATLPDTLDATTYHPAATLYGDVPGAGVVLYETYRMTHEAAYRDGALRSVELLHAYARHHDDAWPIYNDVLNGNAGTGLFLLYAAREMNHSASYDLAVRLGRLLLARAMPEHGGLTWKMREDRDFVLPNFSHGAAGIGYFLATLYQETGQHAFLDGARAAATYLQAVARTEDEAFLVPYGWPEPSWDGLYDIGWAHGPAGTARLFYRLWHLTGDQAWMDRVLACARGIRHSGLPGTPNAGFGDDPFKPDLRFGTASVALFFLDLFHATGDASHLTYARHLTDHLLALGTRDADGLRWEAPRYDFFEHAGDSAAFTGYFYGAAGYGLLLLRLDAAEHRTSGKITLPDDPFAASQHATGPSARNQPALTYDAARGRTVLFGGWSPSGEPLDDTWAWDGTRWQQIAAAGPTPRDHHAMTYDGRHGTVVLFGGWDDTYLGDTWTWDGDQWHRTATSGPSARGGKPALVYDSRHASVLLYGGWSQQKALQDLWTWNGNQWHLHLLAGARRGDQVGWIATPWRCRFRNPDCLLPNPWTER